MTETFPGLKKK